MGKMCCVTENELLEVAGGDPAERLGRFVVEYVVGKIIEVGLGEMRQSYDREQRERDARAELIREVYGKSDGDRGYRDPATGAR